MAKYMAQWGSKGFLVSPGKIVPLSTISTAYVLKSESNNDTSGTPPTNTRGLELEEITLETTYLAAAGVDPRGQVEEWKSLIGDTNPLYIQGKRFGPKLLQLKQVSVQNVLLDNAGRFLSVDLSISLQEYTPPSTKVSSKPFAFASKSVGSSGGSSTSKSAAMSAKPSTDDKAAKKAPLTGRLMGYAINKGLEMAGIKK